MDSTDGRAVKKRKDARTTIDTLSDVELLNVLEQFLERSPFRNLDWTIRLMDEPDRNERRIISVLQRVCKRWRNLIRNKFLPDVFRRGFPLIARTIKDDKNEMRRCYVQYLESVRRWGCEMRFTFTDNNGNELYKVPPGDVDAGRFLRDKKVLFRVSTELWEKLQKAAKDENWAINDWGVKVWLILKRGGHRDFRILWMTHNDFDCLDDFENIDNLLQAGNPHPIHYYHTEPEAIGERDSIADIKSLSKKDNDKKEQRRLKPDLMFDEVYDDNKDNHDPGWWFSFQLEDNYFSLAGYTSQKTMPDLFRQVFDIPKKRELYYSPSKFSPKASTT